MHLNALLDLDVVAVETEDEINLMLELAAPTREEDRTRPPGTLQVVLDSSGSMAGGRLDAAKQALQSIVSRLSPEDSFGVVIFDDEVTVAVPAGPLTNKDIVRERIAAIEPGGMTNLGSGLRPSPKEDRQSDNVRLTGV